jgi:ferric-dicitrate binding protein FerR (iron transport regulator)
MAKQKRTMKITNNSESDLENQGESNFNIPSDKDLEMAWDNVDSFKDEFPKPNLTKMWENTKSKLDWEEPKRIVPFRRYLLRYAAAIAIPLMIMAIGVYYSVERISKNKGLITFVSPEGVRTRFTLPDGSVIWMQPNSEIKYPKEFSTQKRDIFFTGQAFFDIVHHSDWPFAVSVDDIVIEVLGTQFFVKGKPNEELVETSLVSGLVRIKGAKLEKFLNVNDVVVFSKKTNQFVQTRSLTDNPYTWNNSSVVYSNCPIGVVLKDISELYGFDYHFDTKFNQNIKVTLTVREESFKELVEILKIVVPFEYKISESRVIFSARK